MKSRSEITFYLNGRKQTLKGEQTLSTVSDFLRYEKSLTGTKVVCAEGDCGACTALLSSSQEAGLSETARFKAINTCIFPMLGLDGGHLIDPRKEWLEKLPAFRNLQAVLQTSPEDYVSRLSNRTFIVVSTMGHATDLPILQKALPCDFPFIGAIGSTVKAEKLKKNLLDLGVSLADLKELHCPVGEPIGNNTPPEIALSIAAQLLRIRDLKDDT